MLMNTVFHFLLIYSTPLDYNALYKIQADDKAFLKHFPRPSEGIDELLMIIPKKGNILDIFYNIK